ncbi:MAG: hypothetical protein R3A80_06950 [Bdellovibrionota bacterium]
MRDGAMRFKRLFFTPWRLLGLVVVFTASSAIALPSSRATHNTSAKGASSSTSTDLSSQEKAIKIDEENRVYLLGLKIMENFGCGDFVEKGIDSLVDYLRGQEEFPERLKKTHVSFTPEEHARTLTGHFRLLNYTEKTDTPESKIKKARGPYSESFRELSKIINVDLYRSYGNETDTRKIADDLDNPNGAYGKYFKDKLRSVLKRLNTYAGVDYLNIGCRIQGEPKDRNKNKLLVQLAEPGKDGKPVKVHLDEYLKRTKIKKTDVVDATIRSGSATTNEKKPVETVRQAIVPEATAAKKPAPATVPAKPRALVQTPSTGAPTIGISGGSRPPVTKASVPAKPVHKPAPKPAAPTFEQKADEALRQLEPKTTAGKKLMSRFKSWLGVNGKSSVDDFHNLVLKTLKADSNFQHYLISRNPFGEMCTNYNIPEEKGGLTLAQREKVLTKAFLVHLLVENFDNPSTEHLGSPDEDSIGPWQIAMNSVKIYGCKYNSRDEIKNNLDKNIHCLMKVYSYREKKYDKIYGPSGVYWTVLKEGSGKYDFFEEKYEPLFREAVPECKSSYDPNDNFRSANGHTPQAVKDFISAVI